MAKKFRLDTSWRDGELWFRVQGAPPRRSTAEREVHALQGRQVRVIREEPFAWGVESYTLMVERGLVHWHKPLRASGLASLASVRAEYFAAQRWLQKDPKFMDECDTQLADRLFRYHQRTILKRSNDQAYEAWLAATSADLNDMLARYPLPN